MTFLAINASQIVQYINYVFFGVIVIGALIGLMRGLFKSVYYFIVFIAMTLLAWFVFSPLVAKALLNANINMTIGGVYVSTIKESLPAIVEGINPDFAPLAVEGTETYALIIQLYNLVVSIIFTFVFILLVITIFKLIFGLIYLIIRPKRKDEEGNKIKKKWWSRLGGMALGTVHALLFLLVFAIPLSGVSRIGNELKKAQEATQQVRFEVVDEESHILLLSNRVELASSPLEDLEPYIDIYRQSAMGKTFEVLKTKGTPVDEQLFSSILSIKYNDQKIGLSDDVVKVITIYQTISKETNNTWTMDAILNIEDDKLKNIINEIGGLDSLNVLVPVATEIAFETNILPENISSGLEGIDYKELIEKVKNVDLSSDVVNLGNSFVAIAKSGLLDLANNSSQEGSPSLVELINSLDVDKLKEGLDALSEVDLVDIFGDVAMKIISESNIVDNLLEGTGLTHEDINLDGISLTDNLSSIADLVQTVQGIDLSFTDLNNIDFSSLKDEDINNLVDTLYDFSIFNQNSDFLVAIIKEEVLPDEYKLLLPELELRSDDLKALLRVAKAIIASQDGSTSLSISSIINGGAIDVFLFEANNSEYIHALVNNAGEFLIDTICENFGIDKAKVNDNGIDWVDELNPVYDIAKLATKLGIDFNGGTMIVFEDLSDEDIEAFSKAVFSSKFVSQNSSLLLSVLKTQIPEEYAHLVPSSIDNAETLASLLKIVRSASKAIGEDGEIDLSTIDSEDLKDAISSLDGEQISSLITGIIDATGILDTSTLELPEIDTSTDEGVEEVSKLIDAVATISTISDVNDLSNLKEEDIEKITSSKIATSVAVELLTQQTQEGGALSGFITLDGINADEWVDSSEGSGELKKLVEAASVLMDENGEIDVSVDRISTLTDEEIATLTDSKVITNSLNENLNDIIETEITSTFDQSVYGYELNLGTVEVKDDQSASEVWAEEIATVRDVVEISSNLNETDLSNEDTAKAIGDLFDAGKNSQILGEAALSIADSILQDAYSDLEGYEAPTVTNETNFAEEFMLLQALLAKQSQENE